MVRIVRLTIKIIIKRISGLLQQTEFKKTINKEGLNGIVDDLQGTGYQI